MIGYAVNLRSRDIPHIKESYIFTEVSYKDSYLLIPTPLNITSKRMIRHDCHWKLYPSKPSLLNSDLTTRDPTMPINNKEQYLTDLQNNFGERKTDFAILAQKAKPIHCNDSDSNDSDQEEEYAEEELPHVPSRVSSRIPIANRF